MKNKNIAIIIAVAVVLLLIIYLLSMPNYEVVSPIPTPVAAKTKTVAHPTAVTPVTPTTSTPTPVEVNANVNIAPSTSVRAVYNVQIKNNTYDTPVLVIKTGDIVVWRNQDAQSHTVSGDIGILESGPIYTTQSFSYTYTRVGTYGYHDANFPGMKGTIIVTQ